MPLCDTVLLLSFIRWKLCTAIFPVVSDFAARAAAVVPIMEGPGSILVWAMGRDGSGPSTFDVGSPVVVAHPGDRHPHQRRRIEHPVQVSRRWDLANQ